MDLGPKPKVPSKTVPLRKRIRKLKARVAELEAALAKEKDGTTAGIIAAHKAGYLMAIDERREGGP